MTKVVKALVHKKRGVGKHIKNTKMLYEWRFKIDDITYTIYLYHSVWSLKHKVQIFQNRELMKEELQKGSKNSQFQFNYQIQNLEIEIRDSQKTFELYIQNISFREIHRKNQIKVDQKSLAETDHFRSTNRVDRLRVLNRGRYTDMGIYNRQEEDKDNSGMFFENEIQHLNTKDYSENYQLVRQINFNNYNQCGFINSKIASSFASILKTIDYQTAMIFFTTFQSSSLASNSIQSSSFKTFKIYSYQVNVLFMNFSLFFKLNL